MANARTAAALLAGGLAAATLATVAGDSADPRIAERRVRKPQRTTPPPADPGHRKDGGHLIWLAVPAQHADRLAGTACVKQDRPRCNLAGTACLVAWRRNVCGDQVEQRVRDCVQDGPCRVIGRSNAEARAWLAARREQWEEEETE
jgi:hypothetical protein